MRDENFPGEILEGKKLPGGSWSYLVTYTSLGVTRQLFGLYRLQKTSKGYLGPRRINVYCLYMARTLYSVMSHHEIVTTGTD